MVTEQRIWKRLQLTDNMIYKELEDVFSTKRMQKYVQACGGNTRKAMTLYRYNLKLSQEMFTLVSCFEVALRNRIDRQMVAYLGDDWLRNLVMPGGNFYNQRSVEKTPKIIANAYHELQNNGVYSHSKLLASMEFGVWKYLFQCSLSFDGESAPSCFSEQTAFLRSSSIRP